MAVVEREKQFSQPGICLTAQDIVMTLDIRYHKFNLNSVRKRVFSQPAKTKPTNWYLDI